MSNIRFWYDWSQWLVVPFMVLFAVTCLITHATMQINFDDRIGSTLLFFGIPVGMFGAFINFFLNIASRGADWSLLESPHRGAFAARHTLGWVIIATRGTGVCVLVALAVIYAQAPTRASAACAIGLLAAIANGAAIRFRLAKMYGPDREDERRYFDVVFEQQQATNEPLPSYEDVENAKPRTQHGWQRVPQNNPDFEYQQLQTNREGE